MALVDIGANLTHESFKPDLDTVLADARAAGVATLMITGASLEGSEDALALARAHPGLWATAGIHPHHAAEVTETTLQGIRTLLREPEVLAVGETGLDFFRDFSPRDSQVRVFEAHLEMAVKTGKPMFLHERDSADTFTPILARWRDRIADVVVHCFTGDKSALKGYLDLGCHIGITGWICDERRGTHLVDLVRMIPADRLMIETDAPYLMPRNLKPKPKSRRNEPKYLRHICEYVAQCRGETPEAVAEATSANALRFFRVPS